MYFLVFFFGLLLCRRVGFHFFPFLFLLSVPQWAADCTIQAIPSLTIQYMSDSGTVELSRDCGEGTRHMPCHGKEDRNTILNELTCIDDTDNNNNNNDNSLKTSSDLLVDIHQKSVELIKAVPSDNKEDNNIDGVITDDIAQNKSKLSNRHKLNLDEIMMGDQPILSTDERVELKSTSKTEKKQKKKADGEEKYLKKITKKKLEKDDSDELMMGDQPASDDTITTVEAKLKEVTSPPTLISTTLSSATETMVSSTTILSTTETRLRRETEISVNEAQSTDSSVFTTVPSVPTTTSSPAVKITNKIDNKTTLKPRASDEHSSTPHHQREIQEVHIASDHFIPPMLLVRTQFSLSNGHSEHVEAPHKHIEEHEVSTASTNDATVNIKASPSINLTTTEATTSEVTTTEVTTVEVTTATIVSITERPILHDMTTNQKSNSEPPASIASVDVSVITQDASTTTVSSTTLGQYEQTANPSSIATTNEHVDLKKTIETTHVPITESPRFRQPHAPKHSSEFHPKTPSPTNVPTVDTTYPTTPDVTTTSPTNQTTENVVTEHFETVDVVTVTTSSPIVDAIPDTTWPTNCSSNLDITSDKQQIELSKRDHTNADVKHHSTGGNVLHSDHNLNDHLAESIEGDENPCFIQENSSADLSNSDLYQPYRPNRRRVLTKPESHSYIKKVLG